MIPERRGRTDTAERTGLRENDMAGSSAGTSAKPFGDHQLGIPYEPVADLLAKYARRDPARTAIVDLDAGTSIDFGTLERLAIDIAADLKRRGLGKGSRVLVLADEH